MNRDAAIAETRAWLARAVIGLNLCPFAKAPFAKGQIRYAASDAKDAQTLLAHLVDELKLLVDAPEADIETTLLIHPEVLGDFTDYNEFLGTAEGAVERLGLEGVIQVASFHPQYCFAGNRPEDVDNATNRSPYPTLHLLREASVERAVDAFPDAGAIFEANIATMQRLGAEGWAALQQLCRTDAAPKGTPHP